MIMTQVRLTPKYGSLKAACVTSVVTPVKFQSAPHEHKAKLSHELIAGAAAYEVWLHLNFFFRCTNKYTPGSQSISGTLREARQAPQP